MPPKKKKLKKLVDAVSAILGDTEKAKKLKKSEALESFIKKMEDRQISIETEIFEGSLEGKELKLETKKVALLTKQIKKARKLLADMKD